MDLTLTSQNTIAWHKKTVAEHTSLLNEWGGKDFRTVSLTIYGDPQNPYYAAVMVKRPVVIAGKQRGPLNEGDMQDTVEDMENQGYRPYILTATGPADSAVFAGAFTPMNTVPKSRLNLTSGEFVDENIKARQAGEILLWADAFGTPNDTRYSAIWAQNINGVAWNCEEIDNAGTAFNQRFQAMIDTWCRPSHVAVTPAGRYLVLYVDSTIGPWSFPIGMTSQQYQEEYNKATTNNLQPIRVSASGSGSNARFAAIFASREETDPRVFRARGPITVPAIDSAIEKVMKETKIRWAALAIVRGNKLVYAKGYTYAEPEPIYHDVLPTTIFRLGSISKLFAAVAIYRLMQQKPRSIKLNTTLQSVLNLTQPNGSPPQDPRFKDITIRHLLESNSGIDPNLHRESKEAVTAAGSNLPATHDQIMRYIASKGLTGDPGASDNVVYGRAGYFMLSQIISKLAGANSFEQALNTLVLSPLKMTRTRGARTLISNQAPDEARYHDNHNNLGKHQLRIANSLKTSGQPKIAIQYNEIDLEIADGTGGLSSAVVDVARIAAMLSDRSGNPVLSTNSLDSLLKNAAEATSNLSGPDAQGYHGFDYLSTIDAANNVYEGAKGGLLPGLAAGLWVTTSGFSYVFAKSGSISIPPTMMQEVRTLAEAHNWAFKDLFPDFGMFSLAPIITPVSALSKHLTSDVEKMEKNFLRKESLV
jgi:CubicO group peptidase (beta-lactamase class C family)